MEFAVPADHRIKLKKSEKKHKYLDLARELKMLWNKKVTIKQIYKRIIKGTGGLVGRRTYRDHPNYNIIENGQNTQKSPGDLRILAVTQTPAKTDVKNTKITYIYIYGWLYIYIYIYIVIHRQICFFLSELISVAREYLPVAGIYIYIYIYIYI